MKYITAIKHFMGIIGQDRPEVPTIPSPGIQTLRHELIREENNELRAAAEANDIIEVADALCDLRVVVEGAAIAYGFSPELMDELFDEVQRSNLSKTCATLTEAQLSVAALYQTQKQSNTIGGHKFHYKESGDRYVVYRESDKKVLKGINFSEPDLRSILERHGVKC